MTGDVVSWIISSFSVLHSEAVWLKPQSPLFDSGGWFGSGIDPDGFKGFVVSH